MKGPLQRLFETDHRRLDDLLRRSIECPRPIDLDLFGAFRAGLLRHIAMEEKVLFPAARARNRAGTLPMTARLRIDHGALAALLVPTPTRENVAQILSVLGPHNRREEEPGGVYQACEESVGPAEAARLVKRLEAFPEPPLKPYNDGPDVFRHIEATLDLSRRQGTGADPGRGAGG